MLRAVRENEPRALSLGYDVDRYKLVAFVLSAGLAGLAGSLKAVVLQFASLSDVHWHRSGEVVLMTLLGGMGTVMGPSVGALLVVALENYLARRRGLLGDGHHRGGVRRVVLVVPPRDRRGGAGGRSRSFTA